MGPASEPDSTKARRKAVIVGLGVVGSATAQLLRQSGFEVLGYDPNLSRPLDSLASLVTNPAEASSADVYVICVPTPTVDGRSSLAAVEAALAWIGTATSASGPAVIAVRSTLVPGTMTSLVQSEAGTALRARGASFCYWPSFARERQATLDELHPRAVVFGADEFGQAEHIFEPMLKFLDVPVHRLTFEGAELAKSAANAYNALKISYFNALEDWARQFGTSGQPIADAVRVIAEGSWNPEYGTRVGPAFGGACLPKDLDALLASLSDASAPHLDLLEAVRAINNHPARTLEDTD